MRSCRCMLLALSVGVLCGHAYGEIVVAEYNGYVEGTDYDVTEQSQITILEPSEPNLPYDFECYDDSTPWPYDPATIQSITALRNIGDVEIKVRGHEADDRYYGASSVLLLQLNQDGVNSSVKEFNIEWELGAGGATEVDEISGLFRVWQLGNDIYIGTTTEDADLDLVVASANVYITGPGPHLGSIDIVSFDDPSVIDITGTMGGKITLGDPGG